MKPKLVQNYRLFVLIQDPNKPVKIMPDGSKQIPVIWVEVPDEVNLGSLKKPNKEILKFRYEPLPNEEDEKRKRKIRDIFDNFFGDN